MSESTPQTGSYLLDTNIVIALFAADEAVTDRLASAGVVLVAGTVIGELFFGAYNSGRVEPNVTRVGDFAAASAVLWPDAYTAQRYGQLKAELRRLGRPLPENDIWIAALALQHGLTLVSRDAHFAGVPELVTEAW